MFVRRTVWMALFLGWGVFAPAQTQTLKLTDGSTVTGRLLTFKDQFIQVALDTGGGAPAYTNVAWVRISQESLQALTSIRSAAPFARIFLDPPPQEATVKNTKKITIQPVPRLDRPGSGGGLLASPVMLLLLLIAYAANIYAGWEIGMFRQWPAAMTAVVAAVAPVIGPAIFLAMPTRRAPTEEVPLESEALEEAPIPMPEQSAAPAEAQPAQPVVQETTVYARGQFTFNRRFFETKFAGFLKMVPGEAERDKVIFIKSARGEYTGHRFSKVEPNEVFLQIRKGNATEDVMLPFSEIYEVQIKHNDA